MDPRRKILILYASAGHGHEQAARAVDEALRARSQELDIQLIDVLKLTPGFFGTGYRESYLFMIRHLSWLWGFFYGLLDISWVYFLIVPARRFLNGLVASRLERLMLDARPDAIVSTHFLATEVAGTLKRRRVLDAYVLTVVTDYLPHYFWTHGSVDAYAVALEETRDELARRGIARERIHVTGIPCAARFSEKRSRAEIAARLGLDASAFTVLLTSGGAGIGAVEGILAGFPESVQAVVVCGTNKALLARLGSGASVKSNRKIFGFVKNMDELMEASDVVVGKGGGLTVTESLCKGKPMILFRSVPGQETRNARVLGRRGAVLSAVSAAEIVRRVREFLAAPEKLAAMRSSIASVARPRAASDIAERVLRARSS